MTGFDIAAIVGALAWIPPVVIFVRGRIVTPVVEVITPRTIELGFSTFGPIINLHVAFVTSRKDLVVSDIRIRLKHESGETRIFSWQGIVQHLGRISNPGSGQLLSEKEQSVLAIKLNQRDVEERFIRFQEEAYQIKKASIEEKALKQLLHLRAAQGFTPSAYHQSMEAKELCSYVKQAFPWKQGRFELTFEMKSRQRFRLVRDHFTFELNQIDIDMLEKNRDMVEPEYRNLIGQGTPGFTPEHVSWNWRYPSLGKT
jgi:hypothetical protein